MTTIYFVWDGKTLVNKGYLGGIGAPNPFRSLPPNEAAEVYNDGTRWGIHLVPSDKIDIPTLEALQRPGRSFLEVVKEFYEGTHTVDPVDGEVMDTLHYGYKRRIRDGYGISQLPTIGIRAVCRIFGWVVEYGRRSFFKRNFQIYQDHRLKQICNLACRRCFVSITLPIVNDVALIRWVFHTLRSSTVLYNYLTYIAYLELPRDKYYYVLYDLLPIRVQAYFKNSYGKDFPERTEEKAFLDSPMGFFVDLRDGAAGGRVYDGLYDGLSAALQRL